MKTGELLRSGNSGTAPAEGQMAQEERTGGSAEFPFRKVGLVSLPCRLFWIMSNH